MKEAEKQVAFLASINKYGVGDLCLCLLWPSCPPAISAACMRTAGPAFLFHRHKCNAQGMDTTLSPVLVALHDSVWCFCALHACS